MISIDGVTFELNTEMDYRLRNELLSNAKMILTTLKGTNPLNREMGFVSKDVIGRSIVLAKGAYMVQAIEQIRRYEPRLSVKEILFASKDSKLIPKVVLTYNAN